MRTYNYFARFPLRYAPKCRQTHAFTYVLMHMRPHILRCPPMLVSADRLLFKINFILYLKYNGIVLCSGKGIKYAK